jgi:hypothetical protein
MNSFGNKHAAGFEPLLQQYGLFSMADQAESAKILEIAFAAAFRDRQNVIGVPETAPRHSFQAPAFEQNTASAAARTE